MSKILIHMDIRKYGEYDIFHKTDYQEYRNVVENIYHGNCPNTGNKLWFQAIISEISDGNNELFYYSQDMKSEEINERYDFVIAPMANVFSIHYTKLLDSLTEKFENIKIPVYVIACGVQADSYDDLNHIYEVLKKPATKFIKTIYKTGGEFALRGYFTKEFFDRLGFKSAVVTGCPSLYQCGNNLHINKQNLTKKNLRPMFNGELDKFTELYKEYADSEFFDQHMFYDLLYSRKWMNQKIDMKFIRKLIKLYGYVDLKMCLEHRVNLITDMPCWKDYIVKQKFNFSFGSRIHGSLMPILCQIPSVVLACDSRTREMAEFFDLPYVLPSNYTGNLLEIYENADFSKFNQNFSKRYNEFEKFLSDFKIVSRINDDNLFMKQKWDSNNKDLYYNKELCELKEIMDKNLFQCYGYDKLIRIRRKFCK